MRKRVEETLDLLGLADLRYRALHELSGGQQQRVAIGAVLTPHPRVLVLDEPTSALDPTAAEEVLAAITRLVHDLGVTVVLAEHRLERVVQYADRVVHLAGDGTVTDGAPASMFTTTSVAPPVVELGRLAGWDPLPLSVRDARRVAAPLPRGRGSRATGHGARSRASAAPLVLRARNVVVRYGDVVAVRGVDLDLAADEVTAVMGRNGSGKSSLLWALQGSGKRQSGLVQVDGKDPKNLSARAARTLVGLVPQTPGDLLYLETVAAELDQADAESDGARSDAGRARSSTGSRPGFPTTSILAISPRASASPSCSRCSCGPHPPWCCSTNRPAGSTTTPSGRSSASSTSSRPRAASVVVSTHDVEFVAAAADRVVVLADGDIVADGPTADVVVASPAFAPQVAKILAPLAFLTVEQVGAALARAAS